jgi:uncharacterized membrane protein
MRSLTKHQIGVLVFTALYPAGAYLVRYIPNPMVPGASVALNMILPVLAGYFYGPLSGATAGCVGTALAALLRVNMWDAVAIFPHTLMGLAAGWAGQKRSEVLASTTILIGHALNMLFFLRLGMMTITAEQVGPMLLGLAAETMIDIVAIVLVAALLKQWLYESRRW